MSPGEPGGPVPSTRILVPAEILFGSRAGAVRAHEDASAAIERLGWIGEPVVLVGEHIAGHRLPADPEDRIGWVRTSLGARDLAAAAFDEPVVEGPGEAAERAAIATWSLLGDDWGADRLITARDASVGPARRAGLTVVRIGPRDPGADPSLARADHEARDLLDAVRRLMAADAFGDAAGR